MTASDAAIVRALADRLVAEFHPTRIVWFGSRAAGTGRPDSDFDLLVVAATDLPLHKRHFRARWSTRDVAVARDIVVLTPDEFAMYSRWPTSIVHEASTTGRVVFEAAA